MDRKYFLRQIFLTCTNQKYAIQGQGMGMRQRKLFFKEYFNNGKYMFLNNFFFIICFIAGIIYVY